MTNGNDTAVRLIITGDGINYLPDDTRPFCTEKILLLPAFLLFSKRASLCPQPLKGERSLLIPEYLQHTLCCLLFGIYPVHQFAVLIMTYDDMFG